MTIGTPKHVMEVGSLELLVKDLAEQYKISSCVIWSMVGQIVRDERSHISVSPEFLREVEKQVLASCLADSEYLFKD